MGYLVSLSPLEPLPGEDLAGHADTTFPADPEPLPPITLAALALPPHLHVASGLALGSFGKGQFDLVGRVGWGW